MPKAQTTYPALRNVYTRPSLLEAGVTPEAMASPISASDPDFVASRLMGKKADKHARAWAPVLVHNALLDPNFPASTDPDIVLDEANALFNEVADNPWFKAMESAAQANCSPVQWIKSMPKANQHGLMQHRRQWQSLGRRIERILSRWVQDNAETISEYVRDIEDGDGVSFKRLAKFKPKA